MKLTEIAIDGYKGTRNTRLQDLGTGLNVIFSSNPLTRQSITSFILDILYGPDRDTIRTSVWPNGHLNIQSGGQQYRLARPHASHMGELTVSDLPGRHVTHRTPEILSRLDHSTFGTFFNVSLSGVAWSWTNFVTRLMTRFDLTGWSTSQAMPFAADQDSFHTWKRAAESRQARLASVASEIESLVSERAQLAADQNRYSTEYRHRVASIDAELAELQSRRDALTASIHAERNHLAEADQQILELTRFIEIEAANVRHIPVSRPANNYLALFYERLDEVDNQIRRWRSVQSDIQDQRLRLRDEMVTNGELTIDSHEHPYHNARDIALALEDRINRTEEIARTWEQSLTPVENERRMTSQCSEMRGDLQALCAELGRQYKHVRHKAAVAELKQLRRCYHEMDENVKRLLVRRESIIDEIRRLDPAGAEAIIRGDQQLIICAEQEGFLAARQRFVTGQPIPETQVATEYRSIYPDVSTEQARLVELQSTRLAIANRHAGLEADESALESQHLTLIDERNRLIGDLSRDYELRLQELESRLTSLESERINLQHQVESDEPWLNWKPNYLLADASRYLKQLTSQRLTDVWIDRGNSVNVRSHDGNSGAATSLVVNDQVATRLSLSMAAIDQLALRGIRMPVLIDDTEHLIASHDLISTVASFCHNSHQVILLTADRLAVDDCRRYQGTIFELPDTNITTPTWHPEPPALPRQDFPTPPAPPTSRFQTTFTGKYTTELNPVPSQPAISRDWAAHPVNISRHESTFIPTPVVVSPRATCCRNTMLVDIDLVESIYLTPMESLGIRTVGQLLDMDLVRQEEDLKRRGFNLDQIDRWQAQAWLLICLPELSTTDARVLVGSGIDRPEMIMQLGESEILDRIRRYLDSSAGRRSNATSSQFSSLRLQGWVNRLKADDMWRTWTRPDRSTSRRTQTSSSNKSTVSPVRNRRSGTTKKSDKPPVPTESKSKPGADSTPPTSKYQFFLNPSDDVEAAPSIGPRTAEKFYSIGVNSVDEFINSEADNMAAQLKNRRMSTKVLTTWQ